jgi:hypothetical protein
MICPNCAKSIVDAAKFCSFCGAQQPVSHSSPASANTSFDSAIHDTTLEASDVTVILPRHRVDALVAGASPARSEKSVRNSSAPKDVIDNQVTGRPRVPATKIGAAAAAIVIIAVAVVFHANRPATTTQELKVPGKAPDAPQTALEPISMPTPSPLQRAEPVEPSTNAASTEAATPNTPAPEAATVVRDTPNVDALGTRETKLQDSAQSTVIAPKQSAQRKKASQTPPATQPAAIEARAPEPIVEEAPAPTQATVPAVIEPAKVERVVCAESSNFLSRERCLWQECAKPENRSQGECARFTGPGSQR